jgi:hypothetical protein
MVAGLFFSAARLATIIVFLLSLYPVSGVATTAPQPLSHLLQRLRPPSIHVTVNLARGDAPPILFSVSLHACRRSAASRVPLSSPHAALPFRKNTPSPRFIFRDDTPRFAPPRPPAFASHHALPPCSSPPAARALGVSHTHGLPRARLLCWLAAGTHGPRAACTACRGLVLDKQADQPARMRRMYRAVCVAIARF